MPRLPFLVSAAVLALQLSAPGVAGAAAETEDPVSRAVLQDPTGDVWTIAEGEGEEWVSAGDVPTADTTRGVVRHGRFNVVVRMTYTNLRRVDPQSYSAVIRSRRQYGAVFVSAGPGRWKGRHQLVGGDYSPVRCTRLSHSIDYDAERVVVSVPRSCLGRPRWVRAGLQSFMFRGETEEDFQEITDNPHSDGPEGGLTPRLYRWGG